MQKISVIIPTYNSERTIERAINSVLNQAGIGNIFEVEILICDDYSTDRTIDICSRYPVKIFSNSIHSGGPNKGRNRGIREAYGDLIAFLDHDDEWLPNKLISQLKEIEQGAELVYSGYINRKERQLSTIYQTLSKWDNSITWPFLGSILIINKNITLFEEEVGQYDYDWLLKTTKYRECKEVKLSVIRYISGNNLSLNSKYRLGDWQRGIKVMKQNNNMKGVKRLCQSRAKYFYKIGNYRQSRKYFLKAPVSFKNMGYYFTSYIPALANWIVKKYNVWG